MSADKKVRGTTATYRAKDGVDRCDLVELAQAYRLLGNIPERVGWGKACEISLLADAFLILFNKAKQPTRDGSGESE